jgi:putative ABC transport system substrate-binding protein
MRKEIIPLALSAMLLALGFPAQALQSGKIPRIGVLTPGHPPTRPTLEAFRQGLRELGYVEGQNVFLELRWEEEKPGRWPELAADLVRAKVEVIVGTTTSIPAAKQATTTIPIVMATSLDPVERGWIASLARPGGNITGLVFISSQLSGKRLELLKEAIPAASRIAFLFVPKSQTAADHRKEAELAAKSMAVRLQPIEVNSSDGLEGAFRAATQGQASAMLLMQDPFFSTNRSRVVELALGNRLPVISGEAGFAEAGGLMFYGPSVPENWRRAAIYVDKILKGAKPAALPVEQPKKFELVINQKIAKQIGLTIPPNVLARADKVIR